MKRTIKLATAAAVLALAACARQAPLLQVTHPEWVPPQGPEWAEADCDAKSAQAGGYDWVDVILRQRAARAACLKAYGLE